MLEWNAFIKPILYTLELIFGAVVTIGTADKLLFRNEGRNEVHCALADSIAACSVVIILGSLCMLGGFYVLWKRLSSAFLCDMKYRHDTESIVCFLLSLGWLSVASVVSAFRQLPSQLESSLANEIRVTIIFSWLLWVFYIGSVAIAWFAPDDDDEEEPYKHISEARFEIHDEVAYGAQDDAESTLEAWPPSVVGGGGGGGGAASRTAATSIIDSLGPFVEQRQNLSDGAASDAPPFARFVAPQEMVEPERAEENMDGLRPHESIQDLASAWKEIVSADIEAESPEVEIGLSTDGIPQMSASDAEIDRTLASQHQTSLRRRVVRFDSGRAS